MSIDLGRKKKIIVFSSFLATRLSNLNITEQHELFPGEWRHWACVLYLSSSSPLNLKEVVFKTKKKKLVSEMSQSKEWSTERENRKKRVCSAQKWQCSLWNRCSLWCDLTSPWSEHPHCVTLPAGSLSLLVSNAESQSAVTPPAPSVCTSDVICHCKHLCHSQGYIVLSLVSFSFLLNIVSILVRFCLWFDIVSVGVTLGGCAFSQVLDQYWLAVICHWLPLSWCQVTRFYHLSSCLCDSSSYS